jgi:hypothetical protein
MPGGCASPEFRGGLSEIQAELRRHSVVVGAASTIHRWLRGRNLRHKKEPESRRADRSDVARSRRRWRVWQGYMDPSRFVFLDETWASPKMVRRCGWGLKASSRSMLGLIEF